MGVLVLLCKFLCAFRLIRLRGGDAVSTWECDICLADVASDDPAHVDGEGVLVEAICRASPFPRLQGRGTVTALGFQVCRQQGHGESLELLRAMMCPGVCGFARAYLHVFNRWVLIGFLLQFYGNFPLCSHFHLNTDTCLQITFDVRISCKITTLRKIVQYNTNYVVFCTCEILSWRWWVTF